MTYKATWANSDSLTVGFGPNYPERNAGGVIKRFGAEEEAVVKITWESTLTEGGAGIYLPKYAVVTSMLFRVDTAWASSDSGTLDIGHTEADTADVDAFFTATALAAAALTPAGKVIQGDGTYLKDTNSLKLPAVLTDDFDDSSLGVKVFFTKTNNFTAGEGTLIIKYFKAALA